jgi:ADP-L-glycero-D-manno-heptose 6-epimerase
VPSTPTVLVTGGAGFIGSNIVSELTRDGGLDVVVCDRLHDAGLGKWRYLATCPIADFITPAEMFAWLERSGRSLDLIIHMGAVSSTLERDVDHIMGTNFALSRDLFRWCAQHACRFIYASSAATYGDGALGFDDVQDADWLGALRPLNPYGWSKALFDRFVMREAAQGRAPPRWTGLKFFNVYGPNEGHKGAMASIVSQIWPRVARGETVSLFKSHRDDCEHGGQTRDFVYVGDVMDCVGWLARSGGVNGIFNLGSGEARTFADLARAVFAAVGQAPLIEYVDMPEPIRRAYQYHTRAPMDRLRAAGWNASQTRLEDGIAAYVRRFACDPALVP